MPAPDLQTLYRPEEAVETAVKTVLNTATGITWNRQRSTNSNDTPRGEILIEGLAVTGHRHIHAAAFNYDEWAGSLRLRIVTRRDENTGQHDTILGKVRVALLAQANSFTVVNLPYHSLHECMEESCALNVDSEENEDVTELVYRIRIGIRETGWPV